MADINIDNYIENYLKNSNVRKDLNILSSNIDKIDFNNFDLFDNCLMVYPKFFNNIFEKIKADIKFREKFYSFIKLDLQIYTAMGGEIGNHQLVDNLEKSITNIFNQNNKNIQDELKKIEIDISNLKKEIKSKEDEIEKNDKFKKREIDELTKELKREEQKTNSGEVINNIIKKLENKMRYYETRK